MGAVRGPLLMSPTLHSSGRGQHLGCSQEEGLGLVGEQDGVGVGDSLPHLASQGFQESCLMCKTESKEVME